MRCGFGLLVIAVVLGVVPTRARAGAPAVPPSPAAARCAVEDASLRAYIDDQAARTQRWNVAWGIGFAVGASAEYAMLLSEWSPLGEWNADVRAGTLAGAIKASVGVASKLVTPLKAFRAPPATGDACADLAAAEATLRATAVRQRRAFYLNHIGGLAVNLAGVLALGLWADSWRQAAMSFAIGAPIGLLSTYTMPRGAWKTSRTSRFDVAAAPMPLPGGGGLVLAGSF